ncbi:YeeE/YedE thiosulfate transporter family protein [Polynucleobacter sp. IMCC 29146]|uniref:YeeE/YedE thiosulfate transporter family protein n=1 Tax=Polynucleobacter sp. IMCC 29146 TaxID=2780953 RepID=UPI001F2DB9F5|nr:YeeE/YedE thiosulfate transporter family protein [Polynucleobacter sp. IMCC 29146]MCE7528830.1 YeeE/YedE family protein [Polynucleobacter sp. IMCC 29146]
MNSIISGLLLGAAFGFVLERAGFGSPCKLTAQFRLTDWSVFKVMFTAIVFASVGIMLLEKMGYIDAADLFVPPAFLGAAALGGALVGAGFAIGGYCPGTSVVGFVSGRIDAGLFLIGLIIGTWIFADIFSSIEFLTSAGEYVKASTLPEALQVSAGVINLFMIAAALAIFVLGTWMEKQVGGSISAVEAMNACTVKQS